MEQSKLFVGGVSFRATNDDLADHFSPYGTVVDAKIIMDRETGRSRGFGFVTFETPEQAAEAKQALDGQDHMGRMLKIDFATPPGERA
jgi:RNA recognition motif-containing protein